MRSTALFAHDRGAPAEKGTEHDDGHALPEGSVELRAYPYRGEQTGEHRSEIGGNGENGDVAFCDPVTP